MIVRIMISGEEGRKQNSKKSMEREKKEQRKRHENNQSDREKKE